MAQLHASGVLDTKPSLISYSSAINRWAKFGHKDAPDTPLKLLRTIIQQNRAEDNLLRPNDIVYKTDISAFKQAGQANRTKEKLRDTMCTWK
jgi:hypothetical protein